MSGKKVGKAVLGKRYATALFELASKQKVLDVVENDLSEISAMIASSPELASLLSSPIIAKEALNKAVKALLVKSKTSELTLKFCDVLSENRRLALLPEIAISYNELTAKARGEVTAEITSATPLDKDKLKEIIASCAKVTGKKVKVKESVNKDILGGFIIKIGSKMLDNSIDGQLEKMRLFLK